MILSVVLMGIMVSSVDPTSASYDPSSAMLRAQSVNILASIVLVPINVFFITGFFKTAIKQVMGGQISIGDLFSGGDRFWAVLRYFLILYLIMGILTAIALIPAYFINTNIQYIIGSSNNSSPAEVLSAFSALLVPISIAGIVQIVILSGMFYSIPGIIHSRWGAIDSIRNSYRLVGSKIFIYVLFTIIVFLLSMSGVFLCFIGLLITAPFYFTVPAVAYREVVGGEIETMPLPPPPPDHWMNNPQ